MKFNVNRWYKNPNLLAVTTKTNRHLCNIFLPNLIQVCDEYDVKTETIDINDLPELFDASYQLFDSVETRIYRNVHLHHMDNFGYFCLANGIESASEILFNKFNGKQ